MVKDWTKIFKKYKGLWVALDTDETTVLAANQTAKAALKEARENGYKSPILMRVPTDMRAFVGSL